MRKKPILEQVRVEGIAAEGKALARVDDKVVFVPGVAPGDVVDIGSPARRKVLWKVLLFISMSTQKTELNHFVSTSEPVVVVNGSTYLTHYNLSSNSNRLLTIWNESQK